MARMVEEEKCQYMRYSDKRNPDNATAYDCALTGTRCVGVLGECGAGESLLDRKAQFCPAYNLPEEIALKVRDAKIKRAQAELEARLAELWNTPENKGVD